MEERTLVHFAENPRALLEAYADSGEGVDRAGGFAIQGAGGALVAKIDGDYNNVVGFPAASFLRFLNLLVEEEDDFIVPDDSASNVMWRAAAAAGPRDDVTSIGDFMRRAG